MAAARSKAAPIGSAQWIQEERQHSQDLVGQEMEDFGFSVRNELEWLNEHMAEILTHNAHNNLDVFKTPGKLRGKTPRTVRKLNPAEMRQQPLSDIFTNQQNRPSPVQQGLKGTSHKSTPRARFQIAQDSQPAASNRSPVPPQSAARTLFSRQLGQGKENKDSPLRAVTRPEDVLSSDVLEAASVPVTVSWSSKMSSQDTEVATQDDRDIFTQEHPPLSQTTQATSFRRSLRLSGKDYHDTADSFVSAKEALGSKGDLEDSNPQSQGHGNMDVDRPSSAIEPARAGEMALTFDTSPIRQSPVKRHSSPHLPARVSEQYSISAETHDALDLAHQRAQRLERAEPRRLLESEPEPSLPANPADHHEDTVLHHDVEEQMEEEARSPSDGSSPVKPLVRKSSLNFASLPAREPLIPKKSMGTRISRASHDLSKSRSSQLGRFTGGKSLGGTQHSQPIDPIEDAMDLDQEPAGFQREESETTKMHNLTSTKSLKERLNLLNQRNEPPKRISQAPQPHAPSIPQPIERSATAALAYPELPARDDKPADDEEDDWISPVRTKAPAPNAARPVMSKSFSAETRTNIPDSAPLSKTISNATTEASGEESTTPVGSPTSRRHLDGPLSASKAKLYSAFRAAKEKIIGSNNTSAQVKLDSLAEGATRSKLQFQSSSDDVFGSPKRNEKPAAPTSIFSHLRSPSKESLKLTKSKSIPTTSSSSPVREDGPRTRSSSERERQKEKDVRDKETKLKQRAEERLKELREKEQSRAAAHYQKTKISKAIAPGPSQASRLGSVMSAKTPTSGSMLQAPQSRPGTVRMNTATHYDVDSGEEMPPPPPPKTMLPAGTGHKLREPKRLVKAQSKDTLPKGKPQKIQVHLARDRFGQAAAPAATKSATAAAAKTLPTPSTARSVPVASKPAPAPPAKPTASRLTTNAPKPAPRIGRTQPQKVVEKPKPQPSQSRPDLPGVRPVSRLHTVQDATRINVPPINPAKPPVKRPFQQEAEETLHRPAKRPSQMAKPKAPMVPVTPAHSHAKFASGKIPFAESTQSAQPSAQYPNGEDIKLPDIMTDSEDEDSENDFEAPSWVNTPNLREMLEEQQLVDPEQIFGPIAPLNMEQVFPNKERHKRFRERTSSAYWANDQVTEEERRKEREARERLVREGAWTYNPSPRPGAPN
ncbi:hypothetical protein M011DRAFT_440203 [Sporormia fimetaria CBS 119925]|uniref:Inner centromere protein ARK-binding domain-containing protein n=1 Tax=Sporormia fimetaria CBS 119925 TaxID=1340428 RepID=A0A6A6VID4_9PLEO|nr:hypothetical protein M011DRAFT_440203 [Sporormia fimetaria CBS 119925]